ncbi:MAG: alginate export family protein [Gemmatimonadetes bacterium]|nr:alginate export family protein [Gemmatimonadota bacterium]
MPRLRGRSRVADVAGRELPERGAPLDHSRGDLGNAFVELAGTLSGARTAARFGRQELLLGRERIISPLDWANVRRVFEGATWRFGAERWRSTPPRFVRSSCSRSGAASPTTSRASGARRSRMASRRERGRVLESAVLVKSVRGVESLRGQDGPPRRRASSRPSSFRSCPRGRGRCPTRGGDGRRHGRRCSPPTFRVGRQRDPVAVCHHWPRPRERHETGVPAQGGTWDQLYPLGHAAYAGFADALGVAT